MTAVPPPDARGGGNRNAQQDVPLVQHMIVLQEHAGARREHFPDRRLGTPRYRARALRTWTSPASRSARVLRCCWCAPLLRDDPTCRRTQVAIARASARAGYGRPARATENDAGRPEDRPHIGLLEVGHVVLGHKRGSGRRRRRRRPQPHGEPARWDGACRSNPKAIFGFGGAGCPRDLHRMRPRVLGKQRMTIRRRSKRPLHSLVRDGRCAFLGQLMNPAF